MGYEYDAAHRLIAILRPATAVDTSFDENGVMSPFTLNDGTAKTAEAGTQPLWTRIWSWFLGWLGKWIGDAHAQGAMSRIDVRALPGPGGGIDATVVGGDPANVLDPTIGQRRDPSQVLRSQLGNALHSIWESIQGAVQAVASVCGMGDDANPDTGQRPSKTPEHRGLSIRIPEVVKNAGMAMMVCHLRTSTMTTTMDRVFLMSMTGIATPTEIPSEDRVGHMIRKLMGEILVREHTMEVLTKYHDAALVGLATGDVHNDLALSFKAENGDETTLILRECQFYRVVDFGAQNIVSRLLFIRGSGVDADAVEEKLRWASSKVDAPSFLTPERLKVLIERIKGGELGLLYLEPSNGAELVAVFSEMA
ncbi:hypothetical protein [Ralstonia sp. UBA689]|uniref:hypothetical protein n=1 Tax=Ralstonia sp. UBA689 TaxID=1947373 RepID=UPI0025CE9887|nr:hypothetical protein [Ralstonia sp. UBA689]